MELGAIYTSRDAALHVSCGFICSLSMVFCAMIDLARLIHRPLRKWPWDRQYSDLSLRFVWPLVSCFSFLSIQSGLYAFSYVLYANLPGHCHREQVLQPSPLHAH